MNWLLKISQSLHFVYEPYYSISYLKEEVFIFTENEFRSNQVPATAHIQFNDKILFDGLAFANSKQFDR